MSVIQLSKAIFNMMAGASLNATLNRDAKEQHEYAYMLVRLHHLAFATPHRNAEAALNALYGFYIGKGMAKYL